MERYIVYCDRKTLEERIAKFKRIDYRIRDSDEIKTELQEDFGFPEVFEEPFCFLEDPKDNKGKEVSFGFRSNGHIANRLLEVFGDQNEFLRRRLTYEGLEDAQTYLDALYQGNELELAPETEAQGMGLVFRMGHYIRTLKEGIDSMMLFKRFAETGERFRERNYSLAIEAIADYITRYAVDDGFELAYGLFNNQIFTQQIAKDLKEKEDSSFWDVYLKARPFPARNNGERDYTGVAGS
ncbi:MAG: hypothetical protein ABEK59_02325 [Halobacteria archaeon]